MKITELETIPLRLPFAQPFKISQGARETLETLIVRVHTDEGIIGIGETQAWRRQGSAELLWSLVRTIKDHFEPLIAGRSPFDIGGILNTLNEALYNTLYAQAAVADALYDIDAAEQPIAIWDLDGLAALCRATSIPIMADESVSTDHSLLEVIRRRAATVVQTKIAKNGGMYRVWRLWALASAAGMRIYPGNHPSTSVATAAVAQLCAAWPGPLMEGVFAVGVSGALGADIVTEPIVPVNGEIRVPSGPGLGVELDSDAISRFRIDR